MTNTDKLLHALIDSMGFEVEEVVTYPGYDQAQKEWLERGGRSGGNCPFQLNFSSIDYKLTKKKAECEFIASKQSEMKIKLDNLRMFLEDGLISSDDYEKMTREIVLENL